MPSGRPRTMGMGAGVALSLVTLALGCASPQVKVSVAPAVIDREHRPRAWFVRVYQKRLSGLVLHHEGVVCDQDPVIITVPVECPEEVVFSGEMWRFPDRSWCDGPPPIVLTLAGARRIARLTPVMLWRGRRGGGCGDARSVSIDLWPPVDRPAAKRTLYEIWLHGEWWLAPEDTPHLLEPDP